jgi:hypothetical protein
MIRNIHMLSCPKDGGGINNVVNEDGIYVPKCNICKTEYTVNLNGELEEVSH